MSQAKFGGIGKTLVNRTADVNTSGHMPQAIGGSSNQAADDQSRKANLPIRHKDIFRLVGQLSYLVYACGPNSSGD